MLRFTHHSDPLTGPNNSWTGPLGGWAITSTTWYAA